MRPPALSFLMENSPPVAAPTPRHSRGQRSGAPRRFSTFGGADGAPSMSLIAPKLYLGDEEAAASMETLLGGGVTHVLNCTRKPSPLDGAPGAPTTLRLNLLDSSADLPHMQLALIKGVEFIRASLDSGGCVLVHCHRGISRSATLVIAYLVSATRQPVDAVFECVRAKRPIVDPNLSYWIALQEWEQQILEGGDGGEENDGQPRTGSVRRVTASPRSMTASPRPMASPCVVRRSASLRKTPTPPYDSPARPVRPLSRAG